MSEKEYEMDEDYKRAAAFLVEQIAERDEMVEQLKLLPPEAIPEGRRLLGELNKAIERGEQALADEYESYQDLRRSEDARDKAFDDLTKSFAGAYVHAKYRHPEMLRQLDEVLADMDPDRAKAFREWVARHEADDLISMIAQQGETREQTEEFLKNYRAAEGE